MKVTCEIQPLRINGKNQTARRIHHPVRYVVALFRSFRRWESDMDDGRWLNRLKWEIGFVDGALGIPSHATDHDNAYEHGYCCGEACQCRPDARSST